MTGRHRGVRRRVVVLSAVAALAAGGCSLPGSAGESSPVAVESAARAVDAGSGVWDATALHTISVEVDDDAVAEMIATYQSSGEKEWLEATVTIDGERVERAGIRLKGNSSLRGVSDDSDPSDLPWLLRLDKFVDDQTVDGWSELVVRSNSTETALNEAVALDLLAEAGLASEHAVSAAFSVNGTEARLRLVVQNLDERWEAENFSTAGLLYKSEAGGDWSYRGDDPAAYEDVFDQETGEDDLTPLIEFLDFLNTSSDEDFESELSSRLDVKSFARYLAFEDLVDNFDDIDGPGNNSFLRWDSSSGGFTVVAWDHNMAFGGGPVGTGGRGAGFPGDPDGERPGGMPEGMPEPPGDERPDGAGPGAGGGRGPGGSNVLVERFTAVTEWADLVEQAGAELRAELVDSGFAEDAISARVDVLTDQAGDLVDADTVEEDADAIRQVLAG